jgi:glycosyl transferase family 2
MSAGRLVSIVVLGPGTEAALKSLSAQDVDLDVIVERDAPHAGDALSRAIARAKGDILGWLAAGDELLPGALARVVAAIDPDRPLVLGRCAVMVDGVALDYPTEWRGRFEHLAIWKRDIDTVPRASFFAHRTAFATVGAVKGDEPYAAQYDFVCSLTQAHGIHVVDDPWGLIDFDAAEAATGANEREMLETCIALSRSHWGSWLAPMRWRCEASLRADRSHRHDRARHHARLAERAAREGREFEARIERLKTWLLSPAMARGRFR